MTTSAEARDPNNGKRKGQLEKNRSDNRTGGDPDHLPGLLLYNIFKQITGNRDQHEGAHSALFPGDEDTRHKQEQHGDIKEDPAGRGRNNIQLNERPADECGSHEYRKKGEHPFLRSLLHSVCQPSCYRTEERNKNDANWQW